jgi:hypothetical protein
MDVFSTELGIWLSFVKTSAFREWGFESPLGTSLGITGLLLRLVLTANLPGMAEPTSIAWWNTEIHKPSHHFEKVLQTLHGKKVKPLQ